MIEVKLNAISPSLGQWCTKAPQEKRAIRARPRVTALLSLPPEKSGCSAPPVCTKGPRNDRGRKDRGQKGPPANAVCVFARAVSDHATRPSTKRLGILMRENLCWGHEIREMIALWMTQYVRNGTVHAKRLQLLHALSIVPSEKGRKGDGYPKFVVPSRLRKIPAIRHSESR